MQRKVQGEPTTGLMEVAAALTAYDVANTRQKRHLPLALIAHLRVQRRAAELAQEARHNIEKLARRWRQERE